MALHSRYAVTVSATVATRPRADCSSMEDRRVNKRPYQPKHSSSFFNLLIIYASDSVCLHILNFLESIHSCVMCTNFEITLVIFEICIVREPAGTPGP